MGMSTHVVGVVKSEIHEEMVKIKNSYDKLNLPLPPEIEKHFDDRFVRINNTEWSSESGEESGLEVKIKDLPENIESIIFYNSI